MTEQQEQQRQIIRLMADAAGLELSALARKAGLAPSTLTRFMNRPIKHLLSTRTLAKLLEASGYQINASGELNEANPKFFLTCFHALDSKSELNTTRELPALKEDKLLKDKRLTSLGQRMRLVREVIGKRRSDQEVAAVVGCSVERLHEFFSGRAEPTIFELLEYARHMKVTTDFLLSGSIEGLLRRSERLLLDAAPGILEDPEPHPGADPAERGRNHRR